MESTSAKVFTMVSLPVAVLMGLIGIAAPAVVVVMQSRDARALEPCREEIRAAGEALLARMREDPDGMAPALSTKLGNLAPSNGFDGGAPDDSRFLYLGYMFEDGADFNAFHKYYVDHIESGEPFPDAITLPAPRPDGRSAILRLREMTDSPEGSAWKSWYPDPAQVPVLYERPTQHDRRGVHVFFLDGHVLFVPHARTTIFPLARGMPGAINELDTFPPDTSR